MMTTIDSQKPTEVNKLQLEELLNDDDYVMSQKHDGHRVIISTAPVSAYSKHGERRDIPRRLARAMETVDRHYVFDGELIGSSYLVFDLIEIPQGDIRTRSWEVRQTLLEAIAPALPAPVRRVLQFDSPLDKREIFDKCVKSGVEGVIFAKRHAIYRGGKKNRNLLKYKFIKQVDCVVTDKGLDGKDNLELSVYDEDGTLVEVGRVSALQGDGPKVQINDVVTINCLYATKDLRVFHPNTPRIRTDKPATDCTIDQLQVIIKQDEVIT